MDQRGDVGGAAGAGAAVGGSAFAPVRAREPVRDPIQHPSEEPVQHPDHDSTHGPIHDPIHDPVEVRGTVEDGWEPVRTAFAANFSRRGDRGAAVALYHQGRKVVDLWAGSADYDGAVAGAPWAEDSVHTVRSAGKGVAAACLLLLHQRGQLDLDAPVGAYWREFTALGKERVTVRQLLAHRAGCRRSTPR